MTLELRLPEENLQKVKGKLDFRLNRKKGSKRDLLSSVGLVMHCTQAVMPGEAFVTVFKLNVHFRGYLHLFPSPLVNGRYRGCRIQVKSFFFVDICTSFLHR